MHGYTGDEKDRVLLVHCPDAKFGGNNLLNDYKYVYTGLTRAKEFMLILIISHDQTENDYVLCSAKENITDFVYGSAK